MDCLEGFNLTYGYGIVCFSVVVDVKGVPDNVAFLQSTACERKYAI